MSAFVKTGQMVVPGDVLFSSLENSFYDDQGRKSRNTDDPEFVYPGEGCYVSFITATSPGSHCSSSTVVRSLVASKRGVAQWDGSVLSVFSERLSLTKESVDTNKPFFSRSAQEFPSTVHFTERPKRARENQEQDGTLNLSLQSISQKNFCSPVKPKEDISSSKGKHQDSDLLGNVTVATSTLGPRQQDIVHLRITRITRTLAVGEIIAIHHQWCRHSTSLTTTTGSTSGGASAAFRGVLRVEDIRPFRPMQGALQPPSPARSFSVGDVVIAVVVSQSDVRQYQLSTLDERCGVVQSVMRASEDENPSRCSSGICDGTSLRCLLEHIPGRRDAMRHPLTGEMVPKWCPLIPL